MQSKQPMTLHHLDTATTDLIQKLNIGVGSVRRSSAYHDYVALEFAMFVTPANVELIKRRFGVLCDAHDWKCLTVGTGSGNSVFVTLHESKVISSSDQRMPIGDETPSWDKVRV